MSTISNRIKDYDKIRPYLRLLVNGELSLSRDEHSKARDIVSLLHLLLPENSFLPDGERGRKRWQITHTDYMHYTESPLTALYHAGSMTKNQQKAFLCLLSILSNGCERTKNEIYDEMADFSEYYINTAIDELVRQGILSRKRHRNINRFQLSEDYFSDLTQNEAQLLFEAVRFYQHIFCLSVPGNFLNESLKEQFSLGDNRHLCQFLKNGSSRIIDDEFIYRIICAREKHQLIRLTQKNLRRPNDKWHTFLLYPLKLQTDFFRSGRQWLIGIEYQKKYNAWRNDLTICPLENIMSVTIQDGGVPTLPQDINKRTRKTDSIQLIVCGDDEKGREDLAAVIKSHFKTEESTIEVLNGFDVPVHILTLTMEEPYAVIPVIQSCYPYMFFRKGSEEIRQRLSHNLEQALSEQSRYIPSLLEGTEDSKPGTQYISLPSTTFIQSNKKEDNHTLFSVVHLSDWRKECHNKGIMLRPTMVEIRFLKQLLLAPECDFILPEHLRKKLLHRLEYINPLVDNKFWQPIYGRVDSLQDKHLINNLKVFWEAICNKYKIHYTNHSNAGAIYEGDAIPLRLQLNCASGRFQFIFWPDNSQRPVTANAGNINELTILHTEFSSEKIEDKFAEFLKRKQQCLAMILFSKDSENHKTNALSRFYARFEDYDKETKPDKINFGVYHVTLYYYHFQREDLIRGILSLLPHLEIKKEKASAEAKAFLEEIDKRLKIAKNRQDMLT